VYVAPIALKFIIEQAPLSGLLRMEKIKGNNIYNYLLLRRLVAYLLVLKYLNKIKVVTDTGGNVTVQETVYNKMGQVWKTSLPYFEKDPRPSCLTDDVSGCVVYEYDPVGRITKVTNPDDTYATKSYNQGTTTIVDENFHQKVEKRDVYGRLIEVDEYTGTYPNAVLYATTTYKYDVMGNLTDVFDAKNNHTIINYNALSQKTDMTDPDMGKWQYVYDKNGNLRFQTDAKNQKIEFIYDQINRLKVKHYPTGEDVNYTYDSYASDMTSCVSPNRNPIGRLTQVDDASGSEKYCYDKLGRATKTTKTVDNTAYTIKTTYDTLGRTESITYPDNEVVYYTYDEGDNITKAANSTASNSTNFAEYLDYNALGQMGSVTYGNKVSTTYQYYSTNNRLQSIITGVLQDISYNYDSVGNITTLTDSLVPGRTQSFVYDELNRIKTATSTVYGCPVHPSTRLRPSLFEIFFQESAGILIYPL